jgi:hypothetical protein
MGLLHRNKQTPPARRHANASASNTGDVPSGDAGTYRRNRTLTGSLASHVESASEARSELRSVRVQAHDLHTHRRRLSTYLLMSACIIALLGWVIYQSVANVRVAATDAVAIDGARYEQKIEEYLSGHPLQRLRATLDTRALTTYLQTHDCPEVEGVEGAIEYAGFGASKVHLSFRRPVVVWQTGATKLYVDEEGNAFARNAYEEPSVAVVDETGIQAQNNQVLASERFLGTIGRVIGRMKAQGYLVNRVVLPANTTRQLLISNEGVAYPIKFSIDRSAGEQAEDAAQAMRYLQEKGITPEYIDVRVSGKAFYK